MGTEMHDLIPVKTERGKKTKQSSLLFINQNIGKKQLKVS